MYQVLTKTEAEIKAIAKAKKSLLKDIQNGPELFVGRKICPTYVLTDQGLKIDTNQLSEPQIITLVEEGIFASVLVEKYNQKHHHKESVDAWEGAHQAGELMRAVVDYQPSLEGMHSLVALYRNADPMISRFAGAALQYSPAFLRRFKEIEQITSFVKQTSRDFEPVSGQDMMAIIEEMQEQEQIEKSIKVSQQGADNYAMAIAKFVKNANKDFRQVNDQDLDFVHRQMESNATSKKIFERMKD